jgi:hypothetical protein
MKFEDQPWYPRWHQAVERVVSAQMALDSTKPGPDRKVAEQEYQAALAVFRALAEEIRNQD